MKRSIPLITASAVLTLVIAVYVYLIVFPDCLFPHLTTYDKVTVRSAEPIDQRLSSVLDSARTLLMLSSLYDSTLSYRLYLCESFPRYALFSGGRFSSFAVTLPIVNRIFVAKTDILENDCFTNRSRNNRRTFHPLLAHEMTHCLLTNKFGLWRTTLAPKWKTEGYCEFIADASSFDPLVGIQLIKQGKQDRSLSFSYFKYRLYVTYLLTREHRSIEEIMNLRFNSKPLDAEIKAAADSILKIQQ